MHWLMTLSGPLLFALAACAVGITTAFLTGADMTHPVVTLFAVLFVVLCVGVGNAICRRATAAKTQPPRSRRSRRI